MSKGNAFENDLLELILNGVAIANLADDASASPLTDLYVALHTADPGEAGNQGTNEVAYTGYARAAIARDGSGWTITANSASPAATIDFPSCSGGTATATHASVGTAATGTGKLLYKGALDNSIAIATGVIPFIPTDATITED